MKQAAIDLEAHALAKCYALLLRKAQERREQLQYKTTGQKKVKACKELTEDKARAKNASN